MTAEAKPCLEEGIAESPGDIDLAMIPGTGYPPSAADAASGAMLDVSWTKTAHNSQNASTIKFQGAALTAVPEPSSALLLGMAGLLAFRRRR